MPWIETDRSYNRKEAKPGYVLLFFALLFTAFYIYDRYQERKETKALLQHAKFTTGHFTDEIDWNGRPRSSRYVYSYTVDGKEYSNSRPGHPFEAMRLRLPDVFTTIAFPVIYDSLNPDIAKILVLREDFERLHMPFPSDIQLLEKYL